MQLLHMSLAGAMMILVILLFRSAFQHRVHRTVLLVLWTVTALRLLLPVRVASPVSIFRLLTPVAQTLPAPASQAAAQTVPAAAPAAAVSASPAAASVPSFWTPAHILLLVWAVGAAAVLTFFLVNHLRHRHHYQFSLPWKPSPVELPKGVTIRSLDGITTPLTYGILRPVILVPVDFRELETEKQQQMLLHELAHIRRRDVLTKALFLLALSVHWFNPLVWVMVYTASQDIEMRADADAVRRLGSKLPYARTLVEVEARRLDGYLTTGFSYSSTGARLKALQKGKTSLWRSVLALVLLLGLTLSVFATDAQALQTEPQTAADKALTEAAQPPTPPTDPAPEADAPEQPSDHADHRRPQGSKTAVFEEITGEPTKESAAIAEAAPTKTKLEPSEETVSQTEPAETTKPQPVEAAPVETEPDAAQSDKTWDDDYVPQSIDYNQSDDSYLVSEPLYNNQLPQATELWQESAPGYTHSNDLLPDPYEPVGVIQPEPRVGVQPGSPSQNFNPNSSSFVTGQDGGMHPIIQLYP